MDGYVYPNLTSILKILLLFCTVSEVDIFPIHNDSTYKVTVSMCFKKFNFVIKLKCLFYVSNTILFCFGF